MDAELGSWFGSARVGRICAVNSVKKQQGRLAVAGKRREGRQLVAAAGGDGAFLMDKVEHVLTVLRAIFLDKVCIHQVDVAAQAL